MLWKHGYRVILAAVGLVALTGSQAYGGPVFLTGHDPDFHAQDSLGARHLLQAGLQFVTNNTFNTGDKFLWVESFLTPTAGHRVGEDGLNALGLLDGTHYDWVDAAGLAAVNFADYDAIAVASSFGGMLTRAELDGLIARSEDIADFINAGGGLLALAECFPASASCLSDTLTGATAPDLFGFLPITVSSVGTLQGYTLTPFGQTLSYGPGQFLVNADMNDPTHNSFGLVGGLNVVDIDSIGTPTTLAGNVRIDGGVITPVPDPASLTLFGTGLFALLGMRRRA